MTKKKIIMGIISIIIIGIIITLLVLNHQSTATKELSVTPSLRTTQQELEKSLKVKATP